MTFYLIETTRVQVYTFLGIHRFKNEKIKINQLMTSTQRFSIHKSIQVYEIYHLVNLPYTRPSVYCRLPYIFINVTLDLG